MSVGAPVSEAGSRLHQRHWCAVCLLVLVTAASGLISLPLLVRDMQPSALNRQLLAARRLLIEVPLVDGYER